MMLPPVHVRLGERSYDIVITSDEIECLGPFARERSGGSLAHLITDENVKAHAERVGVALRSAGLRTVVTVLQSGEQQKTLAVASQLYDALLAEGADRRTLIVAVGGGVIGDLAGFVASTYTRGLPLLMVPTTLLAMVDSSVGGKVAVNHPQAKNLIGTFHQPVGVWIDTAALGTLPEREYRSGLAEVVKYGVILDADFFAFLEANVEAILQRDKTAVREMILRSCRLKADVVEKDEREVTGLRVVLNYGHTVAHAVETAATYGMWLHGEAVAAGMNCASRLAQMRGLIDFNLVERQEHLLRQFGLPPQEIDWPEPEKMLALMQNDKKTLAGRLRFVLPRRLGEVVLFDDVPEEAVLRVLQEYSAEDDLVLSDETRALLTLHLLPGVGPRLTTALLERFGSATAILQARADQLQRVSHIGEKLAAAIASALQQIDVDAELAHMDRHDVRILTRGSDDYAAELAPLADAPHILYCRGTLENRDRRAIAIVGSRQCTGYGKRMAERLAGDLVRAGFTVVSGLARGIDGMAHRGALEAGGRTIAVLAGGLSRIYPPEHTELARLVQASGALLSEATMTQEPLPGMFPARNRIISGLSLGVVIVEANEKSGALITARHAAEQGRPVFAVPGALDNPACSGCHHLIRQGAILIRGVEDILEELPKGAADSLAEGTTGDYPVVPMNAPPVEPPGLDEKQRRIWRCLVEKSRQLDEMVQLLGITAAELSGTLMLLEMQHVVRRLPGNRYERC